MPCYSPLAGFVSTENGGLTFKKSESNGNKMTVACGSCLGCRLDRSRVWAIRIVHEAALYEDNCFLTLTYAPEHLPAYGSLCKEHFQQFMKRLRKRFPGKKLRYYHCGEYGDKLDRPHYHACLFNLDFADKELFKQNEGNLLFTSETLDEIWGKGSCTIGSLTFESAAYCARYVLKKVTGKNAQDHYLRCDEDGVAYWLEPEYTTMSRGYTCKEHRDMPYQYECDKCSRAIGRDWYEKFKDDVFPSDEVPVPGSGVYKSVPRYYETILESEDPDSYEEIKRLRKHWYFAHGEEYTPERLMQKYNVKRAQVGMLKRSLE